MSKRTERSGEGHPLHRATLLLRNAGLVQQCDHCAEFVTVWKSLCVYQGTTLTISLEAAVFSRMLTYPVRHVQSEVFFIGDALLLGLSMGHVAERLVIKTDLEFECLLVFLDVKAIAVDYEAAMLTRYGQESESKMRDLFSSERMVVALTCKSRRALVMDVREERTKKIPKKRKDHPS